MGFVEWLLDWMHRWTWPTWAAGRAYETLQSAAVPDDFAAETQRYRQLVYDMAFFQDTFSTEPPALVAFVDTVMRAFAFHAPCPDRAPFDEMVRARLDEEEVRWERQLRDDLAALYIQSDNAPRTRRYELALRNLPKRRAERAKLPLMENDDLQMIHPMARRFPRMDAMLRPDNIQIKDSDL